MTRTSSSEWGVVYLGIGNGERFRWLRDEFFPGLSVVAFDPCNNGIFPRDFVPKHAAVWNCDGTNFTFYVRCFDIERDVVLVQEKLKGKRLLLISDIRGVAYMPDGEEFDYAADQELQWQAIQRLNPVSSLVKFVPPSLDEQFFDYVPGTIFKQVFCYYGTSETRLFIDGVPQHRRRYNAWELLEKMAYHHEHLRGQVYETTRQTTFARCLDCCFDCSVLWDTVSTYATQNKLNPYDVLRTILKGQVFDSSTRSRAPFEDKGIFLDVTWLLQRGRLMEAIAVLEDGDETEAAATNWMGIATDSLYSWQPDLTKHLRLVLEPCTSRTTLIERLGSLSKPFTLVKTEYNSLLWSLDDAQE